MSEITEKHSLDTLNQEMDAHLAALESRATESRARDWRAAKLAATQQELRAEYRNIVEPAIKEAAGLERELRPYVSKTREMLAVAAKEGVAADRIAWASRDLGHLNSILTAIPMQLGQVPAKIEGLGLFLDCNNQVMGSADIRQAMKEAGSLGDRIRKCYAELVEKVGEIAKAKRHNVTTFTAETPDSRVHPGDPMRQETGFNVA